MKYDDNARIQQDDVEDIRGAGPARGAAGGGGAALKLGGGGAAVAIIVALVSQLFGVNLGGLFGGGGGGGGSPSQVSNTAPASGQPAPPIDPKTDPDAKLKLFVQRSITDIQDTYTKVFADHKMQYRRAKLVIFTEAVDTGCGLSSAEIGPFYCPPDEKAYIDFSFYQILSQKLNAPGDFAQAYVLAHEIGHHLQNLLGVEEKVRRMNKPKNALSVMQELQADCYAGVWGFYAKQRGTLEVGDIEEAINAAQSIGDDRLQKQAGMNPNAETFTHGSSAQRMKWVKIGLASGKLEDCDTFSAANL
jgi:uncharacterized protein